MLGEIAVVKAFSAGGVSSADGLAPRVGSNSKP